MSPHSGRAAARHAPCACSALLLGAAPRRGSSGETRAKAAQPRRTGAATADTEARVVAGANGRVEQAHAAAQSAMALMWRHMWRHIDIRVADRCLIAP